MKQQTQNDYLQEWKLKYRHIHLAKLVELEALPVNNLCVNCEKHLGFYRCLNCRLGQRLLCKTCCVGVHQHNPFHKIQHWTGKFFSHADLGDLGLNIHLGHNGAPCPQHKTPETWEEVEDAEVQSDKEDYEMAEEHLDTSNTFQTTGTSVVFVDSSGIY